jgi:two-component system phosphate regulon sensor histidine kinase PhoR
MFITSVTLILVVLVLSWSTILSLFREKRISERTTDFLNNMTHEFKTPLTNIALAGKMMTRDTNIGHEDKVRHYSGIILDENEKLRHQVEQVLNMTALERGEIPLQKTTLEVHQVIGDALKSISIQVENRQGTVSLGLGADRHMVTGDRTHLLNVFGNLLDNAVKYSPLAPEIAIRTFNRGHDLVIEVADKGIGIEKEYHQKIFDTFFRVPTGNVHDVKGFGLGLAYTRRIVALHGGTIAIESEKGKGTTFTVTLPYEQ